MKLLIIGRGEGLLGSARSLKERGHDIVGVVTARPNDEYQARPADYSEFARACGAYFFEGQRLSEAAVAAIGAAGADVGISMNWITILSAKDLSLTRLGFLNAHFGDLPRYRGNAALNWAILSGESDVVLTIHRMVANEIDVGEIRAQRRLPIGDRTYVGDIIDAAYRDLGDLFAEAIEGLETSPLQRHQSAVSGGFRTYPRLPSDGLIDWKRSAVDLERLVRATSKPYPGAYTYYRDGDVLHRLVIWKARAQGAREEGLGVPGQVIHIDRSSGEASVLTGEGVLVLELVGENVSDGSPPGTIWRSTRMRLGMNVQDEIFRLATRGRSSG